MADILKLKHIYPNELPDQKFYFYEGECDVHYGVIELPLDPNFEHWAVRAWMKGFRLDPETGREVTRDDIAALYAGLELPSQEEPEAESTESAGETNEGTDVGGQPDSEDGVRESEPAGDISVPEAGVGSGLSDGSDDEATGGTE